MQTNQTKQESKLYRIPVLKNSNNSDREDKDFSLWGLISEKDLSWQPWHTFSHNKGKWTQKTFKAALEEHLKIKEE